MKKRIVWMLVLALLLPALVTVSAAEDVSGIVGNFTWTLEGDTLTIDGSGAMEDFDEDTPWLPYAPQIKKVVFTGGVTYVAANAFADFDSITEVDFGDAMYELGTRSFYSCDGLTELYLPAGFKVFGEDSLRACSHLTAIHCEGRFPSFRLNSLWDTYAKIYYPADKPWSVDLIAQLEEAFHGRIEFLASDGSDPYTPTEATEATTEATTEAATEATTVPTTAPATEATTEPATVPTTVPETTRPSATAEPETVPETQPEQPQTKHNTTLVVIVAAAVMLLSASGAVTLILKARRGGKYLDD